MNCLAANFLTGDSTKILVLEYGQAVANVVSVTQLGATLGSTSDVFSDPVNGVQPRHNGTLNVLYGDGSVGNVDPQLDRSDLADEYGEATEPVAAGNLSEMIQ